jgi:Sulfatase
LNDGDNPFSIALQPGGSPAGGEWTWGKISSAQWLFFSAWAEPRQLTFPLRPKRGAYITYDSLATFDVRQADYAIEYIKKHAKDDKPFFMDVNFMKMHNPTNAAPKFAGKSRLGDYWDSLMELDDNIGRVMDAIRAGTGFSLGFAVSFCRGHPTSSRRIGTNRFRWVTSNRPDSRSDCHRAGCQQRFR